MDVKRIGCLILDFKLMDVNIFSSNLMMDIEYSTCVYIQFITEK